MGVVALSYGPSVLRLGRGPPRVSRVRVTVNPKEGEETGRGPGETTWGSNRVGGNSSWGEGGAKGGSFRGRRPEPRQTKEVSDGSLETESLRHTSETFCRL